MSRCVTSGQKLCECGKEQIHIFLNLLMPSTAPRARVFHPVPEGGLLAGTLLVLDERGGLCALLGVSAMRARVWAAGGAESGRHLWTCQLPLGA
eukprot:1161806-Pelagomonas_calceolata.AAC.4